MKFEIGEEVEVLFCDGCYLDAKILGWDGDYKDKYIVKYLEEYSDGFIEVEIEEIDTHYECSIRSKDLISKEFWLATDLVEDWKVDLSGYSDGQKRSVLDALHEEYDECCTFGIQNFIFYSPTNGLEYSATKLYFDEYDSPEIKIDTGEIVKNEEDLETQLFEANEEVAKLHNRITFLECIIEGWKDFADQQMDFKKQVIKDMKEGVK